MATGQLYDLNLLVSSLYFTPSRDFNILNGGIAKITLLLTDTDSEVLMKESNYSALISDNKLTNEEIIMLESNTILADSITSATIYVHVNATDDPPEVHVPGEIYAANPTQVDGKHKYVSRVKTVYVDEETPYSLGDFYVMDIDESEYPGATMKVFLTAEHGFFHSDNAAVAARMEVIASYISSEIINYNNTYNTTDGTPNAKDVYYSNSSSNNLDFLNGDSTGTYIRQWTSNKTDSTTANDFVSIQTNGTFSREQYGGKIGASQATQIRLQGSVADLNYMLSFITYRPFTAYTGADSITIEACQDAADIHEYVSGISVSLEYAMQDVLLDRHLTCVGRTLPIVVEAVNDPPQFALPPQSLQVHADSVLAFDGSVRLTDEDSADGFLLAEVSVDYGSLTLLGMPTNLLLLNGTGEDDSSLSLLGTLRDINSAMEKMIYTPPSYWDSLKSGEADVMHLFSNDLGSHNLLFDADNYTDYLLDPEALTSFSEIFIVVLKGNNHAPRVRVPGVYSDSEECESQEGQELQNKLGPSHNLYNVCDHLISINMLHTNEDTTVAVSGVNVTDIDDDHRVFGLLQYYVELRTSHGELTMSSAANHGVSLVTKTLEDHICIGCVNYSITAITGTLAQINGALSSLTYTPKADYNGPDYLSVYVNDEPYSAGGLTHNETIPIKVHPVSDRPIISLPASAHLLTVLEDSHITVDGISIFDPDFIDITAGSPTYNRNTGYQVYDMYEEYTKFSYINKTMDHYYPYEKTWVRWNVSNFLTENGHLMRATVMCDYGNFMFSSMQGLALVQTPNVTIESLRLSSYHNNAATLAEKMTNGGIVGTTPVGGYEVKGASAQVWWKVLTVEGRLTDINRALSGLTYRPDLNWNSMHSGSYQFADLGTTTTSMDTSQLLNLDYLVIHVHKVSTNSDDSDGSGATGDGEGDGYEEAVVEIPIEVFPKNDAPILTVPSSNLFK